MIATQPIVTEQVSLKSYDNYYLDMSDALWEKRFRARMYGRLYNAVGILVDEINAKRKSFNPSRKRPMSYWDYRLNKRIEKARKMGHDPRYVSGKAPKRKDEPTLRMRMR